MSGLDDPEVRARLAASVDAAAEKVREGFAPLVEAGRRMAARSLAGAGSDGGGPISRAVESAMAGVESDPLGERRASAFADAALSASEQIQAEARRQVLADAATREAVLRATMAAAIASGLQEQARRHPGFGCDTTVNGDMLAVHGILTVSELVESVVAALGNR